TLVRQLVERTDDIRPDLVRRAADGLGLLEPGATREDREPCQQFAQDGIEQLVAPCDRAGERLLAARKVAGAGPQRAEAFFQPGEECLRREELDTRGGK